MSEEAHTESPVEKAARELLDEVDSIEIDPRAVVRMFVKRVAAMNFPPQNQEKAATLIRELRRAALQQVVYNPRSYAAVTTSVTYVDLKALYDRLMVFEAEARGLTEVPPEKSQFDTWRFRASDLEWGSDFNTLIGWLRPGEKIIEMNRERVITSNRTITVKELWLSKKPAGDPTSDSNWLEQRVHQRTIV